MKSSILSAPLILAALLSGTFALAPLAPAALDQDATTAASQETPPTATVPAAPAQLKREHDRAVKAGDPANDPFDPSSSDTLNQQQLQAAQGASPIVMPPATDDPGNANVEAIPPDAQTSNDSQPPNDSQAPSQPGSPDSVPPSTDVSPSTTDDSPTPPNPVEPH